MLAVLGLHSCEGFRDAGDTRWSVPMLRQNQHTLCFNKSMQQNPNQHNRIQDNSIFYKNKFKHTTQVSKFFV